MEPIINLDAQSHVRTYGQRLFHMPPPPPPPTPHLFASHNNDIVLKCQAVYDFLANGGPF